MEEIKKLREATGAGMVECKKALDEAKGDLQVAIDLLRKKGIAKAAKRLDREANEGIIALARSEDSKIAFILELNSETDFVARNQQFQDFADKAVKTALKLNTADLNTLLSFKEDDLSLEDQLKNLSGTIGEKLSLSKLGKVEGETVACYSHMNGKIGVIVALDKENQAQLANDIAMHIAASNPKYLETSEVSSEEIDREKAIYKEQLLKEGKPENIIDKIMIGKVAKYCSEVCLLEQEFIKDDKVKIKDILEGVNILKFIRFSL
jgi:elongation factor Ts